VAEIEVTLPDDLASWAKISGLDLSSLLARVVDARKQRAYEDELISTYELINDDEHALDVAEDKDGNKFPMVILGEQLAATDGIEAYRSYDKVLYVYETGSKRLHEEVEAPTCGTGSAVTKPPFFRLWKPSGWMTRRDRKSPVSPR